MAVRDKAGRLRACTLACGLCCVVAIPRVAGAQPPVADDETSRATIDSPAATALSWWRSGAERMQALLSDARHRARRAEPDWLHRRSGNELAQDAMSTPGCDPCLVLQEERPDGTDLVTARYTLHDGGAWRTYAGAGLNRAQYFRDDPDDPGPTRLGKGNRHTSYGAAAEMGAELQMSTRTRLAADVRWVDLDDRAEALRAAYGPVSADPLMLGLSVGYRFR